jgi:hypothetical protein
MTESQLEAGKQLKTDHSLIYEQMKAMKEEIASCHRKSFATENSKENYDSFKLNLLNQCDAFVESERIRIDKEFSKI